MGSCRRLLESALVAAVVAGCSGDASRVWSLDVENSAFVDVIVVLDANGLHRSVRAPGRGTIEPSARESVESVTTFVGVLDEPFAGHVRVVAADTCDEIEVAGPVPQEGVVWLAIRDDEPATYWVDSGRHAGRGNDRPSSTDCAQE